MQAYYAIARNETKVTRRGKFIVLEPTEYYTLYHGDAHYSWAVASAYLFETKEEAEYVLYAIDRGQNYQYEVRSVILREDGEFVDVDGEMFNYEAL